MDNSASFLRAARAGNLEKVLEYLKGSIDINTSNANGLNALHLASKEGHVPVVKELLHRGAEVNAATKKGNTALHIASLAGQTDVVRLLVDKGANVNSQSQNGFTPLYMAAQENHDDVVRLLLANNASQSLATEDGFTPLAVALQQGHEKVVAVLLENDAKGKVRLPALHIAAKKDDTKAAALLLQTREHNPDVTSKSGFTPLHIAAHYGNANIAALLLEKGADVNFPAKHQITPLHVAAKWGKANMVKLLLEKGAKLDASTRDGLTPLHCAARSGHDQVVDQLIEKGAPITAKTKNGLAPLHMASQGDHVESAKILLNHKAPVDEITVDYLTALHVAAHCGHVGVAKLLLEKKADANSRALNGFTPLHIACKKNRIKVVELLLRHGASIEATTESGLTPLHVASFMGCMNIVIYLIQHGANADVPTVRGETPLHLAARANQTDIVRILLRNGAQVDTKAREQQTPLHIAARLGNTDIVGLLLQHGAHVDSATKDQYTALHIAAKEGQEDVVNMLLDHGASVTAKTKKGFTPLHLAAKYGNLRVAKLLLQKEADVDAQGKNGVTPLHVAAHYDHNDVALLLLEQGASPHAAAKNGYTPLHIAAKKNQMDIGSTLLEYGAKTNAESKAGFSALHLAAQEGHAEMAALLIEHGANVDVSAKNGLTPLHLCAQEDKVNVAAVLAKHNARIDPATAAGYTPLHVACHFGQTNMIKFLLQHDADVNSTTTHGYTPLHQAAQQGHTMIINLLLENRAQPNATTNQGQTALSIAQKLGYISVIETLKVVTETTVTTTTTVVTEEKYKVVAPETMHETFMSDSEDEGEQDNMMGDHSFKYLTADEMKSLGDDSLPIDVTRDERLHEAHVAQIASQQAATRPHGHIAPSAQEEDRLSPSHLDQSFAKAAPDNVEVKRTPVHAGFLVSFMVDARGGAMRGCRHSGVRVIIPPRRASMPMRVTCRFIRKEKLAHPPPLMEGEACAARVIEMGPAGAKFLGPVVIEVPHFASLRGKEREIVILRSDNGESWKEHTMEATEDAVSEVLSNSFDAQEVSAMQDFNTNRVTRILTTEFPQYFAVVCRNRQEVHSIGPEGGMVSSTVVPQVQAIFPDGALTKKIKVGLQVNKKKKQKSVDHHKDSHLADTETLSDDLSLAAKKPRFGRYFSCLHSASPVKSLGDKRPSDSTTVDIHEGIVAPRKRFFVRTKTTAMRVEMVDSTNNNNMKPAKKSNLKPSFPFGRSNKNKEVEVSASRTATAVSVERAAKDDKDKDKQDKDKQGGSSIPPIPEIELPADNVSDVATVVCESPVKSHTLGCSTPRPIGDSVVEELAISLMTFLNEDKLTDEAEGSSTQRKAVTPELSPARSLLARLTPSKKRHNDQPSDTDDFPSSPKKQRLFRTQVLRKRKGKAKKKARDASPNKPAATPERLTVTESEKAETRSVRSENLEVPNIIKNTQSMESIDLNSETQSRKESAPEVAKPDGADDVQNVSQKKGFLMRFGRHRVSSVVKVATDEPSTSTAQVDNRCIEKPSSDERLGKVSIIRLLRGGRRSSSDAESAQDAASSEAIASKNDDDDEKSKDKRKKRATRPTEKIKVFTLFKRRGERDEDVVIDEEPREGEVEESAEMRVCESELKDEKAADTKSDKEEKSGRDDSKSESKKEDQTKGDSSSQERKPAKKRKKKVLFSRFTIQKPERRKRHAGAGYMQATDGDTSTAGEGHNESEKKQTTASDEKKDEAKSETDTTANQDSGQGTSEPATSERRDSEQSSRGFFSWFTGWRSVDDKIKEVPESCCDTTAEKSEAAKELDPNTEADVSDIQSESESVTDECAGEKPIDLEEQMKPKAEQKDKLESPKGEPDKPTDAVSSKTKSLLKRFRRKRSKQAADLVDSGKGESSEGSRPSSAKTASRPSSASKLLSIFRKSKLAEDTTTEQATKGEGEPAGATTSDKTEAVTSEVDDSAVASDPPKDDIPLSEATSYPKDKQEGQLAENLEEPLSISEKDSGYEPGHADKKTLSAAVPSGRRKPRRNRNRKGKSRDVSAKADVPLTEVAEEKVLPHDVEVRRVEVQMSSPQQAEQKAKSVESKVTEVKDTKIAIRDQKSEGKSPSPPAGEGKRNRRRRRGKKRSPTKPTDGQETKAPRRAKEGRKERSAEMSATEKATKDDLEEAKAEVEEATADVAKCEITESGATEDVPSSAEAVTQAKTKVPEAAEKITPAPAKQKRSLLKFWPTKKSKTPSDAKTSPPETEKVAAPKVSAEAAEVAQLSEMKTKSKPSKKKAFMSRFRKSNDVELKTQTKTPDDSKAEGDSKGENQADADIVQYAESPDMETAKSHQSESPNRESTSSRKGSEAEDKPQKGLLSSFLQWSFGRTESPERPETETTTSRPSELTLASAKNGDKEPQESKVEIVVDDTDADKENGDFRERVQSIESETQRSDTTSKFETPVEEFKPLVGEQKKTTGFFSNFGWPASLWTFGTGTEDEQKDEAKDEAKADTSNETQENVKDSTEAELAEKATGEAESKPTEDNATAVDGVQDSKAAEEDAKTTEWQEAESKPKLSQDARKKKDKKEKKVRTSKAKKDKPDAKVSDKHEKTEKAQETTEVELNEDAQKDEKPAAKSAERQKFSFRLPTVKVPKLSIAKKNSTGTKAETVAKIEAEEVKPEAAKDGAQEDAKPEVEPSADEDREGANQKAVSEAEPKKVKGSFLKNISLPKFPKSKRNLDKKSSEKVTESVKTETKLEQKENIEVQGPVDEEKVGDETDKAAAAEIAVDEKPTVETDPSESAASKEPVAGPSGEEKSTSESAESPKRTITITIPLPKFKLHKKGKGKKVSKSAKKYKPKLEEKSSAEKTAADELPATEKSADEQTTEAVEQADKTAKIETGKTSKLFFLSLPKFYPMNKKEAQIKVSAKNKEDSDEIDKKIEEDADEKAKIAEKPPEESPCHKDKAKKIKKGKKSKDEKPGKVRRGRVAKKGKDPSRKEIASELTKTEADETKTKAESDEAAVEKKLATNEAEGIDEASERPNTEVDRPNVDVAPSSESPKPSVKETQKTRKFAFAVKVPKFKFSRDKKSGESVPANDDNKTIAESDKDETNQADGESKNVAEHGDQVDKKEQETTQDDDEMLTDRPTETPEPVEKKQLKMKRTFTVNFAKFLSKGKDISVEEARKGIEKDRSVDEADFEQKSLDEPKKDTDESQPVAGDEQEEKKEIRKDVDVKDDVAREHSAKKSRRFWTPKFPMLSLKSSSKKAESAESETEAKVKEPSEEGKVIETAEKSNEIEAEPRSEPTEGTDAEDEAKETDKKDASLGECTQGAPAPKDRKKFKFTINFHKPSFGLKKKGKQSEQEAEETPADAKKTDTEDEDKKDEVHAEAGELTHIDAATEVDETPGEHAKQADDATAKGEDTAEIVTADEPDKATSEPKKDLQKSRFAIRGLAWPKFSSSNKSDKTEPPKTTSEAQKPSEDVTKETETDAETQRSPSEVELEDAEADGSRETPATEISGTAESDVPSKETPMKDDVGRKQLTFTITIPKLSMPKLKRKKKSEQEADETTQKADTELAQDDGTATVDIGECTTDDAKEVPARDTEEIKCEVISAEGKPTDSSEKIDDAPLEDAADAVAASKRSWWQSFIPKPRDTKTPTKTDAADVQEEPSATQRKFFRFSKKSPSKEDKSMETLEKPVLEPVPEVSENEASRSEEISKEELRDEQLVDEEKQAAKMDTKEEVVKDDNQETGEPKNTTKERKFYAVFKLGRKVDSAEVKAKDTEARAKNSETQTKDTKAEAKDGEAKSDKAKDSAECTDAPPATKRRMFRLKNMFREKKPAEVPKVSDRSEAAKETKKILGSANADVEGKSEEKEESIQKETIVDASTKEVTEPDASSEPMTDKKEAKETESPVLITKQDITIDAETGSVKIEEVDDGKSSPSEDKRDGAGASRGRRKRRNRNRKNNKSSIVRSCDTEIEKTVKEQKSADDESKMSFVEERTKDVEKNLSECSFVEEGAREMVIESSTGEVTKIEVVSEKRVVTKTTNSSTVVTTSSVAFEGPSDSQSADKAASATESIIEEKVERKEIDKSVVEEISETREDVTEVEQKDGTTVSTSKIEEDNEKNRLDEKKQSFSFFGRFRQKRKADGQPEPVSDDSPEVKMRLQKDATLIDASHSSDVVTEEITVDATGEPSDGKPKKKKRYFKFTKRFVKKNIVESVQSPDKGRKPGDASGSSEVHAQNTEVVKTTEVTKSTEKQENEEKRPGTAEASKAEGKGDEARPEEKAQSEVRGKPEKDTGILAFLAKRLRRSDKDSGSSAGDKATTDVAPTKPAKAVKQSQAAKADEPTKSEEKAEKDDAERSENPAEDDEDDDDENEDNDDDEESTVDSTKNEGESSDSTEIKDTSDEDSAEKHEGGDSKATNEAKPTDSDERTKAPKARGVFGWLKRTKPGSGGSSKVTPADVDNKTRSNSHGKAESRGGKGADVGKASTAPNVSVNGGDSSKTADTASVEEERPKKKGKRLFQKGSKIEDEKAVVISKKGFDNHGQDESAGASTSSQAPKYDHFGRSYIFRWPGVRYNNTLDTAARQ